MDSRSEVRNSAVQILHSTIAACGAQLSPEAWKHCRSEIMFPLLSALFHSDTYVISTRLFVSDSILPFLVFEW